MGTLRKPHGKQPINRLGQKNAKGKAPLSPISIHSTTEEDDEDEFEEVAIPIPSSKVASSSTPGTPYSIVHQGRTTSTGSMSSPEDRPGYLNVYDDEEEIEEDRVIRLEIGGETPEQKAARVALALRKKPMTAKDRAMRLEVHKMHVICLLASARIRNRWASNTLLQARLLSLLPHPLQAGFVIPPKRFPDRAQRSRLFLDALQSLVTWWSQSFFDISDPTLGLRTRTWDEVQEIIDKLPRLTKNDFVGGIFATHDETSKANMKGKGKGKGRDAEYGDEVLSKLSEVIGGERLRSVNSAMKKALQQEGSRDISAQLFVALARACGLGARLIVSLQAVPWRAEKIATQKKTGAGRGGRTLASRQGLGSGSSKEDSDEDDLEEVPIPEIEDTTDGGQSQPSNMIDTSNGVKPPRSKDADLYRLRKVRPSSQKLGSPSKLRLNKLEDLSKQPPVYWAEVFSRSDQRWFPVDPVNGIIRKRFPYEPTSDSGPIRMVYVIAFEEDGYARDVTLRYTRNFGAKTSKLRVPVGKDESDWWKEVTMFLQRPFRLNRDDLEDAELEMSQVSEAMPMHMSGFKDHPIYVLERHLKREEVIMPKREIGRFRGEPVYRRHNVVLCKTADNWMRSGRRIKSRQEPLKWVKQRAVTIEKRRAQELAVQEGHQPIQQGLYAEYQTELYRPPPIKDGIIPQNAFGNIDLYVPTMLPSGAAHLAYKGIAKVAKQLGVSYAEAVTSFEFKKQRAIPVISGIVVASEKEAAVLEAYWESAAAAEERERIRREDRALKRWGKLINGLRVRLRLQAEYGTGTELHEQQRNPMADIEKLVEPPKKTAANIIASANKLSSEIWASNVLARSPSPVAIKQEDDGVVITPVAQGCVHANDIPTINPEPTSAKEPAIAGRPKRSTAKGDVATARRTPSEPTRAELLKGKTTIPKSSRRIRIPKRKGGRKDESEADETGDESIGDRFDLKSSRPTAPIPPRSLRSRAPKNDAQLRAEEERRARVRAALASDIDE